MSFSIRILSIILLVSVLSVIPLVVLGQGGGPSLPPPPAQSPIDGGLAFLAALGGGYAIKKLRDKNKE